MRCKKSSRGLGSINGIRRQTRALDIYLGAGLSPAEQVEKLYTTSDQHCGIGPQLQHHLKIIFYHHTYNELHRHSINQFLMNISITDIFVLVPAPFRKICSYYKYGIYLFIHSFLCICLLITYHGFGHLVSQVRKWH